MLEILKAKLAELLEQRNAAVAELDALAASVKAEERSALTSEEDAVAIAAEERIGALDAEIETVEGRCAELEKAEARSRNAANVPFNIAPNNADAFDIDTRTAPAAEVHERAKRVIGEARMSDEQRGNADRRLRAIDDRAGSLSRHIVAAARSEYGSAFAKLVTDATPLLTPEEHSAVEEVRAVTAGGTSGGGYLMPTYLDPTVTLTSSGTINPMREISRVTEVTGDNWNGVTSAGVTAAYAAESAVVADGSPTFAQPSIDIEKAHAFVPVTHEAFDDFTNLSSDVAQMFQTAKDELEGLKFTLGAGSGSSEPTGVVVGATTTVASATTDTYAIADVYALQQALPARYRSSASWMMSLPIINLTRQFGTAVSHAFLSDLGGGVPPVLLGQSLYENSHMDSAINAGATNLVAVYGDFGSGYQIVDRIGMSIELIPNLVDATTARPTGERGWYARWRNGAGVLNAGAFRVLDVT